MSDAAIESFVILSRRQRDLKIELEQVEAALKDMQPQLREWFINTSTENVRRHGGLVKLTTRTEVHPADGCTTGDVCDALEAIGEADLLNARGYHWTRLPALLRGYQERGEDIPDALRRVIQTHDVHKVKVTGWSKK